MSWSVLICDDSTFAQKQMARALPEELEVSINFASNGKEALKFIKNSKGDVLFLDLNMPIMDGYQTLEKIHQLQLDAVVIVVSGDIQPEAHRRVMELGALVCQPSPWVGQPGRSRRHHQRIRSLQSRQTAISAQ